MGLYQPLVPCPGCARHVRAAERRCPFCAVALPPGLAALAVPSTNQRLSRAAMVAFGATLAVLGCGNAVGGADTGGPDGAGTDSARLGDAPTDHGGPAPAYGLPVFDAGPDDNGAPMTEYGGPPQFDAAPPDDGGFHTLYGLPVIRDAGPDDNGGSSADYGTPPPRDA